VIEKYPGKVRLVFKNFPLRNHPFARPAAVAALAAGEQGKFWEYHDRLFEKYKELNEETFLQIGREAGLDMEAFQASRLKPELKALVDRDVQEGRLAGVGGTPAIFVNGRRLTKRSLQGFTLIIDRELSRSKPK
jgi:protein-disulfide isomerase